MFDPQDTILTVPALFQAFPHDNYTRWQRVQPNHIFTFNIADFVRLAQRHPRHGGIILAAQSKWTLRQLIAALDRILSESDAEDWTGQLRWLNQWRG
jgi:hypothetical protein